MSSKFNRRRTQAQKTPPVCHSHPAPQTTTPPISTLRVEIHFAWSWIAPPPVLTSWGDAPTDPIAIGTQSYTIEGADDFGQPWTAAVVLGSDPDLSMAVVTVTLADLSTFILEGVGPSWLGDTDVVVGPWTITDAGARTNGSCYIIVLPAL